MNKKLITYGVSGMMEFQAIIKIGRSAMKVLFTDGSMNAMGMNPATYTTDSLMVQHAIENSDHFKRGRIHVVRTVELDQEVHIERNYKSGEVPAPTPGSEECEGVGNAEDSGSAEADNEESQIEQASAPASIPMEMTKEIIEMEFDNNDDAKDFLETNFGFVRSKLRNRADIIEAGKQKGVEIKFV